VNETSIPSLLINPTFFVDLASGSQFAVVYRQLTIPMNQQSYSDYWTTVTTMGPVGLGTVLLFSYGDFEYDVSTEYVPYTWPTLLGILGGAGNANDISNDINNV